MRDVSCERMSRHQGITMAVAFTWQSTRSVTAAGTSSAIVCDVTSAAYEACDGVSSINLSRISPDTCRPACNLQEKRNMRCLSRCQVDRSRGLRGEARESEE